MNRQKYIAAFFAGLLFAYVVFILGPALFNSNQTGNFNFVTWPSINPIGIDLRQMLNYTENWLRNSGTPYIGLNLYTPIVTLLFIPLDLISFAAAYKIITLVSLAAYIWLVSVFTRVNRNEKPINAIELIIIGISLVSYGFLFELDRGQFNIIATALALSGVYIFHHQDKKKRPLAYTLFTIGTQLKLYPFIFILLLTKNWRDWKDNLRRFIGLASVNVALLFILGSTIARDFWHAITGQSSDPFVWIGNHSIDSFATNARNNLEYVWRQPLFYQHVETVKLVLYALVALSLICSLALTIKRNRPTVDAYLFMNLTMAALLIPSVSHDYKLPLLTVPTILLIRAIITQDLSQKRRWLRYLGITIITFLFVSTLVSYEIKDANASFFLTSLFENNLPAILLLGWIATLFSTIDESTSND